MQMLLTVASAFSFINISAQNLIQNGSFEISTNNDCYGSFDHHTLPNPHILDNWFNFNSPDYFNSICTNGPLPTQFGYDVPANIFGYTNAKQGNAYVGISVYQGANSEYKEYFYQQLQYPLISGKMYCLNFFVSRADRNQFAVKQIGAYFSTSLPTLISYSYINAFPQIENQGGFISDTTQWLQVQGCFVAQGGEQYITFGNFHDNSHTDTLYVGTNNADSNYPNLLYSYYYFDDITLIDQSTVDLNNLSNLNDISIYPNPSKDILNIDLGSVKENTRINMYNCFGEIVLSEYLVAKKSSIYTYQFPNGIYSYSILVNERIVKTDKIVVIN